MGRFLFAAPALALAVALALPGCQPARTELPASVVPPPPLDPDPVVEPTDSEVTVTESTAPATTASAFRSPGEKHPIAGGTLAASYPRVGVRPPKDVAPAPEGQAWAVVNARFCADRATPIDGALVDPARFAIEVPGQGDVAPAPNAGAVAKSPLTAGGAGVPAGTCLEGSIAFLVAGEGHVESISYDTGDGRLRWAT